MNKVVKVAKGKAQKVVMNKYRALKGSATSMGVNDVVVVKQDDESLKASPLQVYLKVNADMKPAIATQETKVSKIQIRGTEMVDCMDIECKDLQSEETEHTCELTSDQLNLMKLASGRNSAFFIIEELKVRIPFSIYLFEQKDRLIVTDIDGTITKSDTKGFFGGNLGLKVHHENVIEFFDKASKNGYKVIYLTARPVAYQSLTRKYLFESLKDDYLNNWRCPENPVFCLPGDIADAALGDSSKGASGKTTTLTNVLNLFKNPFGVIVGAYGNNNSDSEAYKNVGIPTNMTFLIDKASRMVNLATQEETSYKMHALNIDTMYPKY